MTRGARHTRSPSASHPPPAAYTAPPTSGSGNPASWRTSRARVSIGDRTPGRTRASASLSRRLWRGRTRAARAAASGCAATTAADGRRRRAYAATRDDVTGGHEVVPSEPTAHDLAEVHPGVGERGDPHPVQERRPTSLRPAVADAAPALDAAPAGRAQHVEGDLGLEMPGERQAPQLGGGDVREDGIGRQRQRERRRALPGGGGVGEAAHRAGRASQLGQPPLVVREPQPARLRQGQGSRRQGWQVRRHRPIVLGPRRCRRRLSTGSVEGR